MTPLDLKTEEEWRELLDRFAGEVKMTSCLSDDNGVRPLCRFDRYPLCAAIRENEEAITFICSQTNTAMLAVVRKTLRPEIDLCEAGLVRVVVPIVSDGVVVGQVAACGLAAPDEDEFDAFYVAEQLGLSEEEVLALAEATPPADKDELRAAADRLFDEFTTTLAGRAT